MDFQKITSPSLRDLFVEQLEHLILSGKLKIGEKLPSERQLAEAMQVSRSVVNSGLAELERKGFLIIKPRVGTVVADYSKDGTIETLLSIMKYNGGKMRNEEIRSILEVRIALDTLAIGLCIEHITDEDIQLLLEKIEGIRNASSITEAAHSAFAFQHLLGILSGNSLIPLIFQSFRTPVTILWERFCTLYGIPALHQNNYKLWSFIRDRNTTGAISWIHRSVNESISGSRPIYYD